MSDEPGSAASQSHALMLRRAGQYGVGEIGTAVEEVELPPEAHHTLFMSGMPLDIQKREATHIFRPFEGYKVRPAQLQSTSAILGVLSCCWYLARFERFLNGTAWPGLSEHTRREVRQESSELVLTLSAVHAGNETVWDTKMQTSGHILYLVRAFVEVPCKS